MWLFTKYGFFSIVEAHQQDGKEEEDVLMMVRARNIQHLRNLQDRFESLKTYSISTTAHTDYPNRIFVPKGILADVMYDLLKDIDYSNFKNTIPWEDCSYRKVASEVWLATMNLEDIN